MLHTFEQNHACHRSDYWAVDVRCAFIALILITGCSKSADEATRNEMELRRQLAIVNSQLKSHTTTDKNRIDADARLSELTIQHRSLKEENAALLVQATLLKKQQDVRSIQTESKNRLLDERVQMLEWEIERDSFRRRVRSGIVDYQEVAKRSDEIREKALNTSNSDVALSMIDENRLIIEVTLEKALKSRAASSVAESLKTKLRQTVKDRITIEMKVSHN